MTENLYLVYKSFNVRPKLTLFSSATAYQYLYPPVSLWCFCKQTADSLTPYKPVTMLFSSAQNVSTEIDDMSIPSFVLLPPKSAKSHAVFRKFDLIAVQGHRRSSILVPIESACKFQLRMHLVPFSRYWRMLLENSLFSHPTFVWHRLAEERPMIST